MGDTNTTQDASPTLESLASEISSITSKITSYLAENKLQAPTLGADSPTSFPILSPELFVQKQVLIDALNNLSILVQGPEASIFNYVHSAAPDAATLAVLNTFDFWSAVPLSGSASFESIASAVDLPVEVVTRILMHAITNGFFTETLPGKRNTEIVHSSRSAALARSSGLRSLVQAVLDDAGAPTLLLNEALRRYSKGKKDLAAKPEESAFALLHSGEVYPKEQKDYFGYLESGDGWRSRSYTGFMKYLKEVFGLEKVVLDLYDWEQAGSAHVVDVGGSAGHDAVVLAENFPSLKITVQDLPQVKAAFTATTPAHLTPRISFSSHNFFEPQPITADIYLFKMIFHDYTLPDIVRIFKATIPALKLGAKVILLEYIGDRGEAKESLPKSMRQWGTATDVRLMALFNARGKKEEDWKRLFEEADERFEVKPLRTDAHDSFWIVEAVWKG
ncbi:sterigmatocystin 8-O-methyltransferase [Amniculicola lignicola CBS 123094]|uniref:Sterigmatocystin 8-O-methyltransferase n=1 Tax=Amniculicola lignicola CBS 123094 TaxID=1392246 RepID=A0A6A5W9M7_9PLEO|nr:sterigmatocystin 8-O-methyltransferase [Amniculicola lignicola CBS 123094]